VLHRSEQTNAAGAAAYRSGFYPMQLAVLAVADNFMPIAWWTPISRNPFKFLLAVERTNYSYTLLQQQPEAALCCLPWSERKWVAEAGHLSGRTCRKADALGVPMGPACCLANTWIPLAARAVFEMTLQEVLPEEGDHALFVGRVMHAEQRGSRKDAILFLGFDRLASIGTSWRMRRGRRGGSVRVEAEATPQLSQSPGRLYRLHRRQVVPRSRDEVFAFFARPENLAAITPASLGFELLTPSPVAMRLGTLIDYRIRLLRMPVRWTTYISAFDPPEMFIDVQLRGPYSFWHHTHRFEQVEQGTVIEDEVLYLLPFVPLGHLVHFLWVRKELERIFAYRRERIAQMFGQL